MRIYFPYLAAVIGLVVCGGGAGNAQQLSVTQFLMSETIIVQLTNIDRSVISVRPSSKENPAFAPVEIRNGAMLDFYFNNKGQPEVDKLAKDAMHNPILVLIMDGQKLVAEARIIGEAEFRRDKADTKYGFTLGFESVAAAEKAAASINADLTAKDLDDLIHQQKNNQDDKRFWQL
jgi:nucleoside diphosphate kinase